MSRKSKRLQDKKKIEKNKDHKARRESVGEALGLTSPDPKGQNLNESRALDNAVAAAQRLNEMVSGGKKTGKRQSKSRRSSMTLRAATEKLLKLPAQAKRRSTATARKARTSLDW